MSDVVIRATNLKKVYRLYSKPSYRFLDMFGLLGRTRGAFTEHAALDGVSLSIRRGEKVAIIGRNGAGKSTLLKLVTNVIEPTSGEIAVEGAVHALLQIGTGFHPDFTGRENVYAYFAQLGISGAAAERRCADVIEFAELEEYIDQPMKTYSTGMTVRLMFSASTAITPDLLVLDEVLGVGDAYFAHKSYERIRDLCEQDLTTLLLVTHDIYSAVNICTRLVWIDRGRILMDGDGPTVVKAYEDSVRQQEENRLRVRKQERVRQLQRAAVDDAPGHHVLLEVYAGENRPQPCPVYFSRIDLLLGGAVVSTLPLDAGAFNEQGSHLQQEGTCWGDAGTWQGRPARALLNYGSPFHKIAGVFDVVAPADALAAGDVRVSLDYWSDVPCDVRIRCFVARRERHLGALPAVEGAWATFTTPADPHGEGTAAQVGDVNLSGRHGVGAIVVLDVKAATDAGVEAYTFRHGEPANVLIRYQIHKPGLREHAQVLLAFHRDGVLDTMRMITKDLLFDAAAGTRGTIRARLPKLRLAGGTYTVTVMVAQEGYYDRSQTKYFSMNPEVYTCLSRIIEIVVRDAGIVGTGTGVVTEGEWSMVDMETPVTVQ